MAKSARSSVRKTNNKRLKATVFGPVEQARAERLNKKLLELTQAPKPSDATKMDIEATGTDETSTEATAEQANKPSKTALKKARDAKARVGRRKGRKESNKLVFAEHHKGKKNRVSKR